MKKTIGTVIGIGLVLLLGCATRAPAGATLATKTNDLVGIWHRTKPMSPLTQKTYIQFKEDGTFGLAMGRDSVEEDPTVEAEFWFEGTQLHFKRTAEGEVWKSFWLKGGCIVTYPTAIYEAQLLENGNLKFRQIEDGCNSRSRMLTFGAPEWEPVR